jgi:hypothetical protein
MSEVSKLDDPPRIDVKDAIRRAKTQVADLLEGEAYDQLALEEVKYDDRTNRWLITLGLNRPWNVEKRSSGGGVAGAVYGLPSSTTTKQVRTYKKVQIDSKTGEFVSMEGTDD